MQKNTHWFICFVIGLASLIPSCHGVASNGGNEGRAHSIIDIQPFFGLPDVVRDTIFNKLSRIYPHVELGHCPVKSCYMRDENGGNATAEETGFCSTCRAFLTGKGWALAGK